VVRILPPQDIVAHVRFLNGTPDGSKQGGVVSVIAQSGQLAGTITYGQITQFITFTSGLNAVFSITSPTWPNPLTCTSPYVLVSESYYTLVVAGTLNGIGNQHLQCQFFAENFTVQGGPASLLLHHASPAAYLGGEAVVSAYLLSPPGTSTPQLVATATFQPLVTGTNVAGQVSPAAFTGATAASGGLAFLVVPSSTPAPSPTPSPPGATPTPSATPTSSGATPTPVPGTTVAPSQAVIGGGNPGALPDPTNAFPVAGSNVISIFIIDSPANTAPSSAPYVLVGVID
jgi:hypothetical protein